MNNTNRWGLFVEKKGGELSFRLLTDFTPTITRDTVFYGPSIVREVKTHADLVKFKYDVMLGTYDDVFIGPFHGFGVEAAGKNETTTIGTLRALKVIFDKLPDLDNHEPCCIQ